MLTIRFPSSLSLSSITFQNPGMTFGQLSKFTSAMYAEMPADEKEVWNQRAEADKARFLHELSNYVPPPGYDVKGDATTPLVTHTSTKRRSGGITSAIKTTRDPNAPKRNMSAYLLYQNCMREQFKAHNPGMTFGQVSDCREVLHEMNHLIAAGRLTISPIFSCTYMSSFPNTRPTCTSASPQKRNNVGRPTPPKTRHATRPRCKIMLRLLDSTPPVISSRIVASAKST